MAAVTAPARATAKHQSMLHFVGQTSWSDEALMALVRDHVLPAFAPTSWTIFMPEPTPTSKTAIAHSAA